MLDVSPAESPRARAAQPWLDTAAYPFSPRSFETGEGRISYLDEGNGAPVVLVHGTPTWSFLFRRLLQSLVAAGHRVIAPDHLGFGLSDKAGSIRSNVGYRPEDHARRLAALIESLSLRELTLVVHDFGGPIGLSYAIERPERVARLVVLNSWLWPLDDDPRIVRGSRIAEGPLGKFLYLHLNASPRWLVPAAFADRARLTRSVHKYYLAPFPDAASRLPLRELARSLLGSSDWYDELRQRRERLRGKPTLLLWGMRDPTFGPAYLARWRDALPDAAVAELPDVGHFVPEEAPAETEAHVLAFLQTKRVLGHE